MSRFQENPRKSVIVWLAILMLAALSVPALAQNEQFIPMTSYRVGPYAAGGTGTFGGFIDYIDMLNKRDGGINGVKLTWEECETEYKNDRGVESSAPRWTRYPSSRSATAEPTRRTAASSRTSFRS